MNDWFLLRNYVDRGDEADFEALVKQHIDMVYSAALRQVRDAHLAQDVTQAVFILLARKAKRIGPSVALAGWLYRTANFVAQKAIRSQFRRQKNEREAAAMSLEPTADDSWKQLAPYLDTAIGELNDLDRNAVVLRFLEHRSFKEVSSALGVTEDAAKKRVARALERLRTQLSRKGITVASGSFGALLMAHGLQAAPASLTEASMQSALGAGAAAGSAGAELAAAVIRESFALRIKLGVAIAGAASLLLISTLLPNRNESAVVQSAVTPRVEAVDETMSRETLINQPATPNAALKTIRLQVVAAESGISIPDAEIRATFYGAKSIHADLLTDSFGFADLRRPARPFAGMSIWVAAHGRVPQCLSFDAETETLIPEQYTIRLDRGRRASGRVVDETQKPVAGVKLHFNGEGMKWNTREYVDYRTRLTTIQTDGPGHWTADFLAPDRSEFSGNLKHPDYAETPFTFELGSDAAVTLTISRGTSVSGQVLDADKKPVARATVIGDWGYAPRGDLETETDQDGKFHWPHVSVGKFQIKVTAGGHRSFAKWFEVPAEGLNVDVTLTKTRIAGDALLRGRVVDQSGAGLAGISVSLSHGQPELSDVRWSTHTDDNGRFSWNQARNGLVGLSFSSVSHEGEPKADVPADGKEHVITLKPVETVTINGKVTEKSSGSRIDSFRILKGELREDFYNPSRLVPEIRGFLGEGRDGQFILRLRKGSLPLAGAQRPPILQIQAEGYLPQSIKLPPATASASELSLEIQLDPAKDIRGVVLLPNGQPAAGAQVGMVGEAFGVEMQKPAEFLSYNSANIRIVRTADDGSFQMEPKEGANRLAITHAGGWNLVTIPDTPDAKIQLKSWGRIEGTLFIGQKPGANLSVCASSLNGMGRGNTISFYLTATTDEAGHFSFATIPGGQLKVQQRIETNPGGTGYLVHTQEKIVAVAPGNTATVILGGKGVLVTGRLVATPARPDIAWSITPQNLRPSSMVAKPHEVSPGFGFLCRADGSFAVVDIPPDSYVLEAQAMTSKDSSDPDMITSTFAVGRVQHEFVIPESALESGIYDLGTIEVKVREL